MLIKKPAGELRVTAETKNGLLSFAVAGEGAGMRLDGQARLAAGYRPTGRNA